MDAGSELVTAPAPVPRLVIVSVNAYGGVAMLAAADQLLVGLRSIGARPQGRYLARRYRS